MKKPTIALNKINQLLHSWSAGETPPAAAYSAIHIIVGQLKLICENRQAMEAIDCQLGIVVEHINAMFNADEGESTDFKHNLNGSLNALHSISDLLH